MDAEVKVRKKRGPKPSADGPKVDGITVRVTRTYKQWSLSFAEREKLTESQLVAMGLAMLARTLGYEPPPPR
jgi:hypothetical protein